MVDVSASKDGGVIGEELDRDRVEERRDEGITVWHGDTEGEPAGELCKPGSVGNHHDTAAAGHDFLDIAESLFKEIVVRCQHDDRYVLVNQRDRPVLHLTRGVSLGVDVRNLL